MVGFYPGHGPDSPIAPDIVAVRSVMMVGDSIAVNLRGGNLGGAGHGVSRVMIQNIPTPDVDNLTHINYVGRNVDPAGNRHEAVGGRTFAQSAADFPAAWAANQADEVWIWGQGINDQIAGSTAAVMATSLQAFIQTIRATAGPGVVIRVAGVPPIQGGGDVTLIAYNLLAQNICDIENANGPVEWMAGGQLGWTFANPPVAITGFTDGIVIDHPNDFLGYGAMSVNTFQQLSQTNVPTGLNAVGGQLQMLLDYDAVIVTAGRISQVTDQSGFGRNAVQAVAANQPVLSSLLGRPAGLYTGGTRFLRTALTGALANPWILTVIGPAGNNNGCWLDSANAASRNALFGSGGGNVTTVFAGASINVNINPQLRPRAYLVRFNAGGQSVFVGGERVQVINAGVQLLDGMTIGATVTGLLPFNGVLGCFAVWTGNPDVYAINQWVKNAYPGIIAPFG